MKSLVVGAMLLRTMNAQVLGVPAANANAVPALGLPVPPINANAVNAPAPVITPGINAPSEAELLGPAGGIAPLPNLGPRPPRPNLPTGTADVILDQPTRPAPAPEADIPLPSPPAALANPAAGNPLPIPAFQGPRPVAVPAGPGAAGVPLPNVGPQVSPPLLPGPEVSPPLIPGPEVSPPLIPGPEVSPPRFPRPLPLPSLIPGPEVSPPLVPGPEVSPPLIPGALPLIPRPQVSPPRFPRPLVLPPLVPIPEASRSLVLGVPEVTPPVLPEPDLSPPSGAAEGSGSLAAVANVLLRPTPTPVRGFGAFAVPDEVDTPADAPVAPVDTTVDPVDTTLGDPTLGDGTTVEPVILPISLPLDSSSPDPVFSPIAIPLAAGGPLSPGSNALGVDSGPFPGPIDPNSIYDPTSPYYDPNIAPPGWQGDDNGIYDGEDNDAYHGDKYGGKPSKYDRYDDYEECPSWCIKEDYEPYPISTPDYDYSPYEPTPAPEYPDYTPYPKVYPTPSYESEPYAGTPDYEEASEYYPEPEDKSYPQLKKVRSIFRAVRRQVFNWPQPPYAGGDDDSGDYDGEDGSIPDWLYDISGAPKKPAPKPKPEPKKCPKSCYKSKPTDYGYGTKPDRPTYTKTRKGYKTTEDPYQTTDSPYEPTDAPYEPTDAPYEPTDAPYQPSGKPYQPSGKPYPGYTSGGWYPQSNSSTPYYPTGPTYVPDEPTYYPEPPTDAPYEPTVAPYEPTVVPYEPTTLVTQYQPQPYPEQTGDPGSPAGDYTGDTLDTICPNTCNPFNPAENFCDITTGCTTTGGSKYYCACRAGFRADNYNAKDFSKQFKVAGQPYVYLAVSTPCNTLCSDSTCSEVLERSQCK